MNAMIEPLMTIRRAGLADAPRLAALSEVLGYPVASDVLAQRLSRLLARAEHVVLLAEVPAAHVVGWLHGAEQELMEYGRRCEILGLVVDAEHRRHGVGRRLVTAVEEWALQRGLDVVTVRSNIVRPESHPFYEGLGYARVKTQHAYQKQLGT
jgi:GNAT superfamily N-acetyltransferase